MVVGVPAAYALARMRSRSDALSLWILASRLAPPTAFAIPFFLAYRYLHLLDTRLGLVIIYLTFNLSLGDLADALVLREHAARAGGSRLDRRRRLLAGAAARGAAAPPAPGIATTAILCFVFSWNDFFFALILTRTNAMTAPVAVVNFMNYAGWEWGRIAAGGTMVMLPVLVFSLLVRRFLVSGLTAGAVKG